MKAALKHLIDLQNVDLRLLEVRARLAVFPKRLAEVDEKIAAARGEVEKAKAAHLAAIKDRKKYELDVESWKEKAKKYKEQSYLVKTNDAFKALQHEAQTADEEIAKAEDRLLEQMVAGEEYDRRIKSSEKILKEVEEVTKTERGMIESQRSAAEKECRQLEAERAAAVAEIPDELRDHYTRIARKHGGTALAEIRDEKCGACGMRVRPHVFQEIRRDDNTEIYHCETCTRMLYYIEPPAVPASAAAAPAAADATTAAQAGET